MDKELSRYLTKSYPKIFTSKRLNEDFTWGFECDSGWFKLLNFTCSNIQQHIDQRQKTFEQNMLYKSYIDNDELDKLPPYMQTKGPHHNLDLREPCSQVVATQIKEKFGTLRFYCNGGDDFCEGVLNLAQSMSECICEVCGDEGKLRSGGWLKVLCYKHAKDPVIAQEHSAQEHSAQEHSAQEHLKGQLNLIMNGQSVSAKIVHQLSEHEAVCETQEGAKIHAIRVTHPKIVYWYGTALE